ncbi:hypothetical protein ABCS02_17875 [Microbacterium sp. X-17]|uniref:hypothetical protein n=1 Tax=Microbacterium sp. X-17 TaxID=3144404 RepID=UPI0031F5AA49
MLDLPQPLPWRASDQEAVELCRKWMTYLGAPDVVVASDPVKPICDLYSSRFLAWVDNRRGNLGLDAVEKAAATASADGRYPLLFLSGGILPEAQDRADVLGLALLRFDAQGGNLDGANRVGRQLRLSGLAVN